jgi:hypothetical protein
MEDSILPLVTKQFVRTPQKPRNITAPIFTPRDPKPRDSDKRKPKNLREWQTWMKEDE